MLAGEIITGKVSGFKLPLRMKEKMFMPPKRDPVIKGPYVVPSWDAPYSPFDAYKGP